MIVRRNMVATEESPSDARRLVRETLSAWAAPVDLDDATLIVSELSTNALRYDGPDFTVGVGWDGDGVWVEIEDDEPNAPAMRDALDDAETGRGLAIVEALCVRCDVRARPGGKYVRATMSETVGPPAAPVLA